METLENLIKKIGEVSRGRERITVDDLMKALGKKSFGSVLFLAGFITLAPIIGDIPGVPTLIGVIVILTSLQLLANREKIWLPAFLRNRSVEQEKILYALKKMNSVMKFVDRFLKERLTVLTKGAMVYGIAVICFITAMLMPFMEFIPFSANIAGFILTMFGLSLLTNDGLLVIVALAVPGLVIGLISFNFV